MQKNVIITLFFAIFIAIFAVMNAGKIPVNLIFVEVEFSAALVIIFSAFTGAVIVYSLDALSKMKTTKSMKNMESKLLKLQEENTRLTNENKQLSEKKIPKPKAEIEEKQI